MRTVTIPEQTITEAIQSIDYQIGSYVQVVVGSGSEVNNNFQFTVPQNFDVIRIMDAPEVLNKETGDVIRPEITDFSDLMEQYPGGSFAADDLWPYIDKVRARR